MPTQVFVAKTPRSWVLKTKPGSRGGMGSWPMTFENTRPRGVPDMTDGILDWSMINSASIVGDTLVFASRHSILLMAPLQDTTSQA